MKKDVRCLSFVVLLSTLLISGVEAQNDYPNRPVRVLFGFSAGSDLGARLVAEQLAGQLGNSVVLENITGATGNIAADHIARSEPNGYTAGLLTGANIVLRPLLHRAVPYEPLKALVPVGEVWRFPNILVVSSDTKVEDLQDLINQARRSDSGLTFGHLGIGSVAHLSGELLRLRSNAEIRGIPYRNAAALISDVVSGRLDMAFVPPSTAIPLARKGQLRALATTASTRSPFAPDIPTVAEVGYADFAVSVWFGLFVPSGTPQPLVDRLSAAMQASLAEPNVRDQLLRLGLEPVGGTQSEFKAMIAGEEQLWKGLIDKVGIDLVQ